MKSISEWFDDYGESHQNQTNKKIHWVCVPAILFSIIGILAHFSTLLTALLLVLTLVFYARLDLVLAVAMAALLAVMAWLIVVLPVGVGFYIGSSLIVLNFSETAYPHDEEYFGPRQVSFGPRPRHPFCRPSYPSGYDGHEWALVFYRPICQLWACWKGYAPPFSWR